MVAGREERGMQADRPQRVQAAERAAAASGLEGEGPAMTRSMERILWAVFVVASLADAIVTARKRVFSFLRCGAVQIA
jgi:hypothetical protein